MLATLAGELTALGAERALAETVALFGVELEVCADGSLVEETEQPTTSRASAAERVEP
ncbi:MAG: hypothetical protein U0271_41860 [Polyangiaceae bacterium]